MRSHVFAVGLGSLVLDVNEMNVLSNVKSGSSSCPELIVCFSGRVEIVYN